MRSNMIANILHMPWLRTKINWNVNCFPQTIVTGAGDETLRFWNVFPSMKTPVSRFNLTSYLLLTLTATNTIFTCLLLGFQAPVKETGLWSLGRTYIR